MLTVAVALSQAFYYCNINKINNKNNNIDKKNWHLFPSHAVDAKVKMSRSPGFVLQNPKLITMYGMPYIMFFATFLSEVFI